MNSLDLIATRLETFSNDMRPKPYMYPTHGIGYGTNWKVVAQTMPGFFTADLVKRLDRLTLEMMRNSDPGWSCPRNLDMHKRHLQILRNLWDAHAARFCDRTTPTLRAIWKDHANALVAKGMTKDEIARIGHGMSPVERVNALARIRFAR